MSADLLVWLESLREEMEVPERVELDPLGSVPRDADANHQELVAYLAAGLAFGNVTSIGRSVARVVSCLDNLNALKRGHRWVRADDLRAVIGRLKALQTQHGSLGRAFELDYKPGDMKASLTSFCNRIRSGLPASRGVLYLASSPANGSACKRLSLFLRWMVRRHWPDLGLWSFVDPADLVSPLDVHVVRFVRKLGVTSRTTVNWRMAENVTSFFRTLNADDPLLYDFAISHYGMVHGWDKHVLTDTLSAL